MSGQEVNPFGDPKEINAVSRSNQGLEYANPFVQQQGQQPISQNAAAARSYGATPATTENIRAGPPILENTQYGDIFGGQTQHMRARQEELERKAVELEKREQELKQAQIQGQRVNNFPPLPSFCCVGPCFYHDINVDIPIESQKTCKFMFIIWQCYVFCLFFNCLTGLAALCIGYDGGPQLFGVGLLYLFLFTPCSFIFWYRPIYKALRSGSSFNYMLFFVIFLFQAIFTLLYALGINFLGTCGWINGAGIAASKLTGKEAVTAMFFISGASFSVLGIAQIMWLRKIHTFYRRSGASLEKAQSEFTLGIASNKTFQNAAAEAVKAGISSNMGTRY